MQVFELMAAVAFVAAVAALLVVLAGRRRGSGVELDAELSRMHERVAEITEVVRGIDAQRAEQHGQLTEQLRAISQANAELHRTTGDLRQALSSSQSRGQWGERMVEDVLRAAGMVEGVNYRTQATTSAGTRPDVTFLLPYDRVVHMDVKFPLARYLEMLRTDDPEQERQHRAAFLRAVRDRVAEVTDRGYVDVADGTLDCVLLFIPNDQIYAFVHEHAPELFDDALARGVVICSPTTLLPVLTIIRQASEQFALERTSDEILELLAGFSAQWERFCDAIERVGRGLDTTQRAFDALNSTRRTQLERQLDRIEELRQGGDVHRLVVVDRASGHDVGS